MKTLLWLMLKKEAQKLPRRILIYVAVIGLISIIKYGLSTATGILVLKLLIPVYLVGLFFRTAPYIYLLRLMANNYKVDVEDIAYVVYVKGVRPDQLQMKKDVKSFILEQCKDRNPG